jgi:hypothetical protein
MISSFSKEKKKYSIGKEGRGRIRTALLVVPNKKNLLLEIFLKKIWKKKMKNEKHKQKPLLFYINKYLTL